MNIYHTTQSSRYTRGFTLIELMLATGLGLMLLVGLIKIIAMVNDSFAETRVLVELQNRCRSTQMLLQNDLSHISVTPKPPRPTQADDGYLSMGNVDNMGNGVANNRDKFYRGTLELVDTNLIDDCNFVAFTVFNRDKPFTFQDPNSVNTLYTPYAEIVWFVYRNDLYRVCVPFVNSPEEACNYRGGTRTIGTQITDQLPTVRMISPALLGELSNRIMCTSGNKFLGSLTNSGEIGYQLRNCLVLPNVMSFKVQVWDPKGEKYRDINSMGTEYYNAQSHPITGATIYYDTASWLSGINTAGAINSDNPNVLLQGKNTTGNTFPPTTAFLPGMRIIVRAFDPDSGTIREFRVGQDFRMK